MSLEDRTLATRHSITNRPFIPAIPVERASHFDILQPINETGGISDEVKRRYTQSARFVLASGYSVNAYVAGSQKFKIVKISGDITKLCAIISAQTTPAIVAQLRTLYATLKISQSWSSAEYEATRSAELMFSTCSTFSVLIQTKLADGKVVKEYKEVVLIPLSQVARMATSFAAILNARSLHDSCDISQPVKTQLLAALSNRLDYKVQGGAWIRAFFCDILNPEIHADYQSLQHKAVMFCANIVVNSLEKIKFNPDPYKILDIYCATKDALLKLPTDLIVSEYSRAKGQVIRLAQRELIERIQNAIQQREDYFQALQLNG